MRLLLAVAVAGVPTLAPAQAVLQVPAAFADIGAAIAAAQPGDVVEVAAGTYPPFSCGKAVTVTAVPGATVRIEASGVFATLVTGFAVPPGGTARVRGLQFVNPSPLARQRVQVTSGCAAFESCTFEAAYDDDAALRVVGAAAWLRACRCSGHKTAPPVGIGANVFPCAGLKATNATVAAVDCEFAGGDLVATGIVGAGDGVLAASSRLHLARCLVRGGGSGSLGCFYPNGHGVHVANGAGTWLVDTTVLGGSHPGCAGGGDALRNAGSAPVHLTRVVAVPGSGTSSSGAAITGPVVLDAALGLAGPTVDARLGAPWRVDYRAAPGALVLLFASDALAPQPAGVFVEPTWLPAGAPFVAALTADAAGTATFATSIPSAPTLRHASLWLHAAEWTGTAKHVAPPIGGVLH
jgi:hypothetical protein